MPIALLFMFAALAIITPTLMSGVQQDNQLIIGTVAAKQLHQITDAAKGYITSYAANIETQATSSTPAVITVADLENTGFLPQGFNTVNPYGQTWEVEVLQPTNGNLDALVLSVGGQPIPPADAPRIASESGAAGGIVQANNTAQGAYGGWTVPMAGYTNPGTGHLAGLIGYSNGQLQSDYLYRVAVPGQPQLNTMQTNLDMGANNINNVQNVNVNQDVTLGNPGAATGGYAASAPGQLGVDEPAGQGFPSGWGGGIHTWDIYANGSFAAGVDGSIGAIMNDRGGDGGQVYVNSQNSANYAYMDAQNGSAYVDTNGMMQGGYINSTGDVNAQNELTVGPASGYGGNWWANNAGDSSQAGNAYVGGQVTANYDATLGTAFGSANIGWGCSPNGAIAANANGSGQVLACQGGSWQAMGGGGFTQAVGYQTSPDNSGAFGWFKVCVNDGFYGWGENADVYPAYGPNAQGQYYWEWYNYHLDGHGMVNTIYCFN